MATDAEVLAAARAVQEAMALLAAAERREEEARVAYHRAENEETRARGVLSDAERALRELLRGRPVRGGPPEQAAYKDVTAWAG